MQLSFHSSSTARRSVIRRRAALLAWALIPMAVVMAVVAGSAPAVRANPLEMLANLPDPVRQRFLKMGFVVNFAKFTEWPVSSFPHGRAPLRLCVLGQDPFGEAADSLNGRKVAGRRVSIEFPVLMRDVRQCHVLFISSSARKRVAHILRLIEGAPILTVSDMPDFVRSGGMIGLVKARNRFAFEASQDSAEQAGLRLSSNLLALARSIEESGRQQARR